MLSKNSITARFPISAVFVNVVFKKQYGCYNSFINSTNSFKAAFLIQSIRSIFAIKLFFKKNNTMRKFILALSTTFAAGLLFVNIYNSLIDAVSWGSNMPASILTAREYFKTVNPGDFFRIFSPINQVLALVALVICWKTTKQIRTYCALALLVAITSDALTFAYFYPRNEIMFTSSILCRSWGRKTCPRRMCTTSRR